MTPEFVEIGNWAMLVERGLDPNVAKRVTKQYMDKCAEVERFRASARLVWRWRNKKASDQEMVESAKSALCPEQDGKQCCRAECNLADDCIENRHAVG